MVRAPEVEPDRLYTPGEVAEIFRVDPKTVVRWIKAEKFPGAYVRTVGGHHRVYGRGILRYMQADRPAAS